MPKGGYQKAFGTGHFIKRYLDEEGESYVWEIFENLKEQRKANGEDPPSYESFRSYLWKCKELGLIENTKEEESPWGEKKQYYKLLDKDDIAWDNPAKYYLKREVGV